MYNTYVCSYRGEEGARVTRPEANYSDTMRNENSIVRPKQRHNISRTEQITFPFARSPRPYPYLCFIHSCTAPPNASISLYVCMYVHTYTPLCVRMCIIATG